MDRDFRMLGVDGLLSRMLDGKKAFLDQMFSPESIGHLFGVQRPGQTGWRPGLHPSHCVGPATASMVDLEAMPTNPKMLGSRPDS